MEKKFIPIHEASRELDKYGVWVKSDPQTLSAVSSSGNIKNMPLPENLFDNDIDDIFNDIENIQPLSKEIGDPTLTNLKERAGEEPDHVSVQNNGTEKSFKPTVGLEKFDDPAENQKDTAMKGPPLPEEVSVSGFPISDASIRLLTNILQELSLIKQELTDFKALVQDKPLEETTAMSKVQQSAQKEPEKIVLAGDELDDILNSADFPKNRNIPIPIIDEFPAEVPEPLSSNQALEETVAHTGGMLEESDEGLQWLREKGDKPLSQAEADSTPPAEIPKEESKKTGNFSIDDLLIETGSIRDIPIDLNPEEDEESEDLFEEVDFELDPENMEGLSVDPFDMESDPGPSGEEILGESALDLNSIIDPDEEINISNEELDKLEQNILLEFSEKLPVIDEIFGHDENICLPLDKGDRKKKTYK
ncbi:MAG: hypothetical protein LBD29_10580 [Treponema sp.]|jgi:hypothetical protein|nr:hypothetical protein [Treponema sp.]